jgi:uncharacterized protein (TIGR02145 family)
MLLKSDCFVAYYNTAPKVTLVKHSLPLIIGICLFSLILNCNPTDHGTNNSANTVIDADGNVYTIVKIGTQTWTAENLKTTKYNDGTEILQILDTTTWKSCIHSQTAGYCYCNNTTNADSITIFGALYNWYAVNTGKLAPTGWHIPTDAEWNTLQNYLIAHGYNYDGTITDNLIAKAMAAQTNWTTYSTAGTPGCSLSTNSSSGFSGLPGGYRTENGQFKFVDSSGCWWSASGSSATYAIGYIVSYREGGIGICYGVGVKSYGFSVRLVKDN